MGDKESKEDAAEKKILQTRREQQHFIELQRRRENAKRNEERRRKLEFLDQRKKEEQLKQIQKINVLKGQEVRKNLEIEKENKKPGEQMLNIGEGNVPKNSTDKLVATRFDSNENSQQKQEKISE